MMEHIHADAVKLLVWKDAPTLQEAPGMFLRCEGALAEWTTVNGRMRREVELTWMASVASVRDKKRRAVAQAGDRASVMDTDADGSAAAP